MRTFSKLFLLCAATLLLASCSKDESKDADNSNSNNSSDTNGGGTSEATVSGTVGGHDYVDLGLPSGTLWATCNIGATKPEEYGGYYAFGETKTKERYDKDNSDWNIVADPPAEDNYYIDYTDWCGDSLDIYSLGLIDENGVLVAKYDAATANWGNDWRMPTEDEIMELLELHDECVELNGVRCTKLVGKNGNILYLPTSGYRRGTGLYKAGTENYLLSSTVKADNWGADIYIEGTGCYCLDCNDDFDHPSIWAPLYRYIYELGWFYGDDRLDNDPVCWGYSIRPVLKNK